MIQFEEALEIVLRNTESLDTEIVDLKYSLNRVLATDVKSDINMPPFNKSAVDGYACRSEDINDLLEVIEIIPAGKYPEKEIVKNTCAQIMTGAPVPEGADKIVMVEHIELVDEKVKVLKNQKKSNISLFAEDVKDGDIVLEKNQIINARQIATLASVGCSKVEVYKQPKIGIISTGDELVEPDQYPQKSQIRNSNGHQLIAQCKDLGIIANYYGIVKDDKEQTNSIINDALSENDLVLLTGGVSMGEFDFVPEIMKKNGLSLLFEEIAIKPGKPTVFGKTENKKYCFGLPGNPVSSYVLFELLVKKHIYKLMNYDFVPLTVKLPLSADYMRSRIGRLSFIPVRVNNGEIFPVEYHGSGHIHSLSLSDGLITIPIGVDFINKGELLDVRFF